MAVKNKYNKILSFQYILPAVFFLFLVLISVSLDQTAYNEGNFDISGVIAASSFLFVGVIYILFKNKIQSNKLIIILLFILGFAMRLIYVIRFGYTQNQHDVESLNSSGHLSYIYSFVSENSLPKSNDWQFSHPPLHHFIASVIVKISLALGLSLDAGFENVQLLTLFYSTLMMFVGFCILKELKVNNKMMLVGCSLFAFHPTFFILAGSVNNDCLAILLSMLSILYLIKWYNNPSVLSALLCGIFCGFGMMAKVSVAVIAVVVAVCVIIKSIFDRSLKLKTVALHTCVFLLALIPLGLWHPIRNYILFQQPLGYVAPLSVDSALFTGDISATERLLFPISFKNIGVYTDVWNEHNIFLYVLRNSLFGEYNFGNIGFAFYLVLANCILVLLTVMALIVIVFKRGVLKNILPIVLLFLIQITFFIYFNIKYPFGCSMDFRYIVPALFSGIAMLSLAFDDKIRDGIFTKIMNKLLVLSVAAFSICSVMVFI